MTIVLHAIDYGEGLAITGFNQEEDADNKPVPAGSTRLLVRAAVDLEPLDNATILRVYNFLKTGKQVPKLKSRASGIASVWALLQHRPDPDAIQSTDSTASTDTTSGAGATTEGQPAPDNHEEADMANSKTTKPKKSTKKATAKKAARKASTGPRGEKTLAVAKLLSRASGCTAQDIKDLTGWPAVSVPAMAKAAGLKLRKEKEKGSGKPTRYWGT